MSFGNNWELSMFRFLCNNNSVAVHDSNLLTFVLKYPTSNCLVRFISNNPTHQNNCEKKSFTISYLINTCGLSQDKAISSSKRVQFKNSTKPDSVLTLFRDRKFPNIHISKIIEKLPQLLVSNVDKLLKPKLDVLASLGFSGPDLAEYLSATPGILHSSLEKSIVPSVAFLKSIVGESNTILVSILKRAPWIVTGHSRMAPNIALLRAHSVPDSNILLLLKRYPRIYLRTTSRLKGIIEEVKNIETDASTFKFIQAMEVWASTSESTRQAKVAIFKKWGWSEDDIRRVLRVRPDCLKLSAKNITQKIEFFVTEMDDPLLLVRNPQPLTYSMEKRIIPRRSVIKVLTSRGLVREDHNIITALNLCESDFIKRYITKFEEEVPELLNAYRGRSSD